jgi:hypothetical protein
MLMLRRECYVIKVPSSQVADVKKLGRRGPSDTPLTDVRLCQQLPPEGGLYLQ